MAGLAIHLGQRDLSEARSQPLVTFKAQVNRVLEHQVDGTDRVEIFPLRYHATLHIANSFPAVHTRVIRVDETPDLDNDEWQLRNAGIFPDAIDEMKKSRLIR